MGERAPYSRVYWTIIDDPKFADIYDDNHHLATWVRLLMTADMAWPASAQIPASARRASVEKLAEVGLLDLQKGSRFRIHGLDAERGERKAAATRLATGRGPTGKPLVTDWSPDGLDTPGLSRDEPRRDETSIAPAREDVKSRVVEARVQGLPSLDATVARIWEETTGRSVLASGAYVAEYLDEACRRHKSPSKVGSAIYRARKTFDHIPDGPSMVAAMRPILDPFPDPKATAKAERERELAAASRRGTAATLRRNHELGGHENQPHGACPVCQEVTA